MSPGVTIYTKASMVRISTFLLAVLVGFTVVGLPVAAWLVLVARGRVELDADGIRLRPGGAMRWADVARFGIGFRSGALSSDSASAQRVTTIHLLLRDNSGRRLAVHINNYAQSLALLDEIKRHMGRAPERLHTSFPFQRLSFRED